MLNKTQTARKEHYSGPISFSFLLFIPLYIYIYLKIGFLSHALQEERKRVTRVQLN